MENKEFPNGLTSYLETYYEVVSEITQSINLGDTSKRVNNIYESQGRGGLYELTESLTDKFEKFYCEEDFAELDFYETIDKFLGEELYNADK